MYSYDVDNNSNHNNKFAIFTWFERTVRLVVKLGARLQPTQSRKSIGMCVTHYTIESINLAPTGPEIMQVRFVICFPRVDYNRIIQIINAQNRMSINFHDSFSLSFKEYTNVKYHHAR